MGVENEDKPVTEKVLDATTMKHTQAVILTRSADLRAKLLPTEDVDTF